MGKIYSGFITENEGFNGPEPFAGPVGWTVDKMGQTEIFKVRHGLGLKKPNKLRVVVTTVKPMTVANVESVTADDFTISVWTTGSAPAMTGFHFVAVLN